MVSELSSSCVKSGYPDRALRYDFVEAVAEGAELLGHGLVEVPVDVGLDELLLVLAREAQLRAAGHQLDDFLAAPVVVAGREVQVHLLDCFCVEDVAQRAVQVGVELAQVLGQRGAPRDRPAP
jgi:hypothetical protein